MKLPNKLTMIRVCMVPVFVVLMLADIPFGNSLAGLIFILASATDALDGHIARKNL